MFSEETLVAAGRRAYLLDLALQQARAGKLGFNVICHQVRGHPPARQCDALAILRRLSLKQLVNVETKFEKNGAASTIREDELGLNTKRQFDDGKEVITLTIVNEQVWAKHGADQADIRRVTIEQTAIY